MIITVSEKKKKKAYDYNSVGKNKNFSEKWRITLEQKPQSKAITSLDFKNYDCK